ncbi:MAG: hypothetical protein ACXVGB_01395 [Mycobacteriaceae bacterium]
MRCLAGPRSAGRQWQSATSRPDTGTHTVYVTNRGDATVSVIDRSTRTISATVPVGKSPSGVTVDPGTHTICVAMQETRCR